MPNRSLSPLDSLVASPDTFRQLWNCEPHRDKVLAEDETMPSEIFPPDFPSELRVAAFRTGDEVAWSPILAAAAVEWLGTNGYAVLGTELWLLKDGPIQSLPVGLSGTREVHGNTVNRGNEEPWSSFVARAVAETRTYLQGFKPSFGSARPNSEIFPRILRNSRSLTQPDISPGQNPFRSYTATFPTGSVSNQMP
jgi:hypothetical protein